MPKSFRSQCTSWSTTGTAFILTSIKNRTLVGTLLECPAYMSHCSQAHHLHTTLSRACTFTVIKLLVILKLSKVSIACAFTMIQLLVHLKLSRVSRACAFRVIEILVHLKLSKVSRACAFTVIQLLVVLKLSKATASCRIQYMVLLWLLFSVKMYCKYSFYNVPFSSFIFVFCQEK
jgi:predicted outer membrane lipoprotein